MLSLYLNFCAFAFVASITPGPTNLISLMIGTRQGALAALPFILGASLGMTLILWFSGIGLASLIANYPLLQQAMSWGGGLWLSWLAWKLIAAPASQTPQREKRLGWRQGAILQVVNPKAWMMALSTIGLFALPSADGLLHTSLLAVIFFLIALPCQLCWSWLGQSAGQLKSYAAWETVIHRLLALLLLASVWSALLTD